MAGAAPGAGRAFEPGDTTSRRHVPETRIQLRYLNAPRMIACTGDRTPAREVIATRNLGVRG